jgi:colanic acid/amylovoran biosynthesis glycosyltransferase
MSKLCIISGPRYISETFIRAHEEQLAGPKIFLNGVYPEFEHDGRGLRYTYTEHKRFRRLLKVLPHWLYERNRDILEPADKIATDSMREFLIRQGVDVVLAEYGMTGADMTAVARDLNIPLIVHFHGHDAYHRQYLADYKSRLEEMFAYASHIVSVSEDMTRQLISLGAPEAKLVLNPYGPRNHFYEIEPEYGDCLIAVGRFAETKAPHLTISAFKLLADEIPEVRLIMVGDGPLRESCMSLAEGLGLNGRIEFPGALGHQYSKELLSRACCFVQHSITTSEGVKEGTPVAILEAGAAALPVVATRHAGIIDAVQEGVTGFLVEEKDVAGMKEAMKTLFQNRDLCRQMGARGREHVGTHYRMERHIGRLQALINEARTAQTPKAPKSPLGS